jgi:hypothetical protein
MSLQLCPKQINSRVHLYNYYIAQGDSLNALEQIENIKAVTENGSNLSFDVKFDMTDIDNKINQLKTKGEIKCLTH